MQATKDEVRRLAEAVTTLVDGAHRGMARTFDVTRVGLLRLAAGGEPVRPSDIADALDVNPSTVTRYVRALEDDGYVRVSADPADRRSCLVAATDAGHAELARLAEAGVDVLADVIRDWSADDVRRFAALIERLAADWARRGPVQTRPPRRGVPPRWRAAGPGEADR
jgi:DNA-binding MarR family transcriptional regulator